MNVQEKMAYAKRTIESITRHDDEDSIIRIAAVEELHNYLAEEQAALEKRVRDRLVKKPKPAAVGDGTAEKLTIEENDVAQVEADTLIANVTR